MGMSMLRMIELLEMLGPSAARGSCRTSIPELSLCSPPPATANEAAANARMAPVSSGAECLILLMDLTAEATTPRLLLTQVKALGKAAMSGITDA